MFIIAPNRFENMPMPVRLVMKRSAKKYNQLRNCDAQQLISEFEGRGFELVSL